MNNPARTSLEVTDNAFTGKEGKKTRGDILYERNTARKQLHEKKEELEEMETQYEGQVKWMYELLVEGIKESTDKPTAISMLWKFYAKHPSSRRVFTKYSTGEVTHRGISVVIKKGQRIEEDAHLTPDGKRYKPWKEGDEPSYFMKSIPITPENFTIQHDGTIEPRRRY